MASDEPEIRVVSTREPMSFRGVMRSKPFRYLLIGGSSFVLDFGLIFILHDGLAWPVWIATTIAFLASFAYNYSLQRRFAFNSRAAHGRALAEYTALVAINTVITVAVVALLDSTIVGWAGGKVLATVITTFGNYFAYRYWIFRTPTRENVSK